MDEEQERPADGPDPATRAGRVFRSWLQRKGVGQKDVDPLLVGPLLSGFLVGLLPDAWNGEPDGDGGQRDSAETVERWSGARAHRADWSDEAVRREVVSLLPRYGHLPAMLWDDRDLFLRLEAIREEGEPRRSLPVYPLWLVRAEPPLAEALVGAACIVDAPYREGGATVEGHERALALFSEADEATYARAVLAAYAHVRGARDWGTAFRAGRAAWREGPRELRGRAGDAAAPSPDGGDGSPF